MAPNNIQVSSVKLHQLIFNLCINARDAMQGEGDICIRLKMIDAKKMVCDSCHHLFSDSYIQLTVSDTGEGISSLEKSKIFEPFFTTKDVGKGTGMGLSMVHGIVHRAGGHITLESVVGKGADFSLYFPVISNYKEESTAVSFTGNSIEPEKSARILVIEDETAIGLFLQELLVDNGHDVVCLTDASHGLDMLLKGDQQFDILITDQTMPGYTGIEVAEKSLAKYPELNVILMTGYHETVDESVAKSVGCKGFLRKPFDPDALLKIIKDCKSR
jgi:CheY-like chemotaxis protein